MVETRQSHQREASTALTTTSIALRSLALRELPAQREGLRAHLRLDLRRRRGARVAALQRVEVATGDLTLKAFEQLGSVFRGLRMYRVFWSFAERFGVPKVLWALLHSIGLNLPSVTSVAMRPVKQTASICIERNLHTASQRGPCPARGSPRT